MVEIILSTMLGVGKLLLLVVFAFLANTLLGATIADNTDTFDTGILLKGIKKGILILVAIFMLTVVFVAVFPVAEELGVDILTPEITDVLSITALVVPIFSGLVYYVTQSIKKVKLLFGHNVEEI